MKTHPHFNVNNLPMEVDSNYMKAAIAEETRVCGPIDARILEMENEYLSMSSQLKTLANETDNCGFFARWNIQGKMKAIGRRMLWHRDVLARLYKERWKRTYG